MILHTGKGVFLYREQERRIGAGDGGGAWDVFSPRSGGLQAAMYRHQGKQAYIPQNQQVAP